MYGLALIKGLMVTLKNLRKKPFTVQYPEERLKQHPRFRGEEFVWYEERCTGCASCAKYCPLGIIKIVTSPSETAPAQGDKYRLEVFDIEFEAFFERLQSTPHTVKRALTDQRVFAGIGNAYSDEILFEAGMSPFKLGRNMTPDEGRKLFDTCRDVLARWVDTLRKETGGKFPAKVTAFHPQMAVHGKYREPCMVCGAPVQRIVKSENESNYCARCQTGGRLLADRSLSRLLKDTYPKRIEELEGP